jgi:hypothetical protein
VHGKCASPYTCDCFGTGYTHCQGGHLVCGCDDDECAAGEKPCDILTDCTNFQGNFTCSPCPAGYTGTPYLKYPLVPYNKTYYTGGCVRSSESIQTSVTSAAATSQTLVSSSNPLTTGVSSSQVEISTSASTSSSDKPEDSGESESDANQIFRSILFSLLTLFVFQ